MRRKRHTKRAELGRLLFGRRNYLKRQLKHGEETFEEIIIIRPPISTTKNVGKPFFILLFTRIEPTTTMHKASTGNASRDGGIIWVNT